MHPWLTHRRLAAGNRWRRWWRNQPEGFIYLIASVLALAILIQPLLAVATDHAGLIRSVSDQYQWTAAALGVLVAVLVSRPPLLALRQMLERGLWCALPRSRRTREATRAQLVALLALGTGIATAVLLAWLGAPAAAQELAVAAAAAFLATLCMAALRPKAKPLAPATAAASHRWPAAEAFAVLLRRWQRQRLSFHWRSGALSSTGLLLSGLLLPAGTGMGAAVAGLIGMLLVVRILALHNSAAGLIVQADRQLRALPIGHRFWFAGHARAVLPEALLLATLIATSIYAVGAPLGVVLGAALLLVLLSLIDLELVSRWRRLPRRRSIAWAVLGTTCAALGPQAAPLLPLLLLIFFALLRVSRPK